MQMQLCDWDCWSVFDKKNWNFFVDFLVFYYLLNQPRGENNLGLRPSSDKENNDFRTILGAIPWQ